MNKVFQKFSAFFLVSGLCLSCAQIGAPTGGPRDEDPPVVLESIPPNYSTRFESKKILITFDEYIVLDNVNQELIVSPPMEEKPEVKLRKKTMIIEFEEELLENTTYTFNFGNAIKDLHEGNKLQNYEYVFSTGEVLDSMSVRGTLLYAKDLTKPEDPISVMLYSELRDSVPLTDIPLYVGRSNDSGVFSVNNLRPGEYKVFALNDGNNNLRFDMASEEIAFLDSSLTVHPDFVKQLLGLSDTTDMTEDLRVRDTINVTDTLSMAADTLQPAGPELNALYIDLMLFTEDPELQYIADYNRDDRRKLEMVFAIPVSDSFQYHFIQDEKQSVYLEEFSTRRDSLTLWVLDSTSYQKDSLFLAMQYTALDTAMQYVSVNDTLVFSYREKTSKRGKKGEEEEKEKLKLTSLRNGGFQNLHRELGLRLDFPLEGVRDSLIRLYHIPDSVEMEVPFRAHKDSTSMYRAYLEADWESDASYKLLALPGAFTSVYPIGHDTLEVSFQTRDSEYYGRILLTVQNVQNQVLVQLLNENALVKEIMVETDGQYEFPNLDPKEFSFKFIHDLNGNGRWDTGKYLEGRQPEQIEFLPKDIEVRSNWDHDVTMVLKR